MKIPDSVNNRFHPDILKSDLGLADWSHCGWEPEFDRKRREREDEDADGVNPDGKVAAKVV